MVTFLCARPYRTAWAVAIIAVSLGLTLPAQAQLFSHGAPPSTGAPDPATRPSVTATGSPLPSATQPAIRQRGPLRHFGPREPKHSVFIPIPIFYPIYTDGNYQQVADPYVAAQTDPAAGQSADNDPAKQSTAREDELRMAYLQGAREAMAQDRDDRSTQRSSSSAADDLARRKRAQDEEVSAPPQEDNSPSAIFIFKDGRKLETKNFAIMGAMLYDLSSGTVKKVQLADLDKDATIKANDDRGIQVKLP